MCYIVTSSTNRNRASLPNPEFPCNCIETVEYTGQKKDLIVIRVLFVCTGNICRSPTADGVFTTKVKEAGLGGSIIIDSCGLTGYHAGEQPDLRAQQMAQTQGYDLSFIRAREIKPSDYHQFDYILGMDQGHLKTMQKQAPAEFQSKLHLFLDFNPALQGRSVPDPYYGGESGFKEVFDMIEQTASLLLSELKDRHGL